MKRTPLYEQHKQLGARLVDFAGWEMPVQYSGLIEEHLAVRKQAGLFDVSHMGEIEIRGASALDLVQQITCNDAAKLIPGRSQYSALLTPEGTFVDDIMVYRLATDHFLLCVNASNIEKDFQWILTHNRTGAQVENRSDDWALLALQGPLARSILPSPLKKTQCQEQELGGAKVLLSATGYTGEDGFEIFCRPVDAAKLWCQLFESGRTLGLLPCGLGARDTLRLEAAYPLYGHEIDVQTTPFEAGLGWIVKMEKGDFIGRQELAKQAPLRKQLVGLQMTDSGIARQGYKIFEGARESGIITSGTYSPLLEKAIAIGFLTPPLTKEPFGKKVQVDIRGKKREASVVALPFYKR